MSCLVLFSPCVFFSPFSIAITSLGEERANLSDFRTFVRFVLVWFCLFPIPLGVWEGLQFVIVALPGLFSYLFFICVDWFFFIFSHLSYFWWLGKAVFRDCGISWVSSLIYLRKIDTCCHKFDLDHFINSKTKEKSEDKAKYRPTSYKLWEQLIPCMQKSETSRLSFNESTHEQSHNLQHFTCILAPVFTRNLPRIHNLIIDAWGVRIITQN